MMRINLCVELIDLAVSMSLDHRDIDVDRRKIGSKDEE